MKMVIWSAAMLAAAAGTAFADKQYARESGFNDMGATGSQPPEQRAGAILTVPMNNLVSFGAFGLAGNVVINIPVLPGAIITGIGYDVTITANSPSWLSEISVALTDSGLADGVGVSPGYISGGPDDFSGQGTYSFPVFKWGPDFDFALGGDGILRLELYEYYDDASVAPDGLWKQGNLYIQYVPTPAGVSLLGLAGVAALGRKRRA